MTEQRPFSIKIFVPDGDPDGLRIVEKSNWTGEGVVFNRTSYKAVATRPEFNRTGVYVLVGSSEDSSLPTIYEDAKGFVVCKGSQAVRQVAPSIHNYLITLRKDLVDQGVLVEEGEHYCFTQDQVFQSPSTAAGAVQGRSANGRIDWKTKDGRTLKELQEAAAEVDS